MTKAITTILFLAVCGSLSAAEVRLRSSAVCSSSVVRVGDVAEVAGDESLAQALADIALCPAPAAKSERVLTQQEVRRLLALSGLERSDCLVTGSESVTVTGGGSGATALRSRQPVIASGVRQALFEVDLATQRRPAAAKPAAPETTAAPEATKPTLVERNASVSVAARTAGVRITTSGKALEAGKAGDSINVELADSKQRVLATVVGMQSVEVVR